MTMNSVLPIFRKSCVSWMMVLLGLPFIANATARAETVSNSHPSPIYRALHPDASVDNQIVTFHFGGDTFNVPRNYLIGGSDVPRPNEPGGFIIEVLLPDLAPRTAENRDKFSHVAPGLGDVIRLNVEYNIHLSPIDDVLDRIVQHRDNPENYSITQTGLKKYKTFTEDIYIKQNGKSENIFFTSCMGDIQKSPAKGCTVFDQYSTNIALYYFFDRRFAEGSYEIDQKLRSLINSFIK